MQYKIETQLSVQLANSPGAIAELSELLTRNNISMSAISFGDGPDNGRFRFTTRDAHAARERLTANGFALTAEEVISIRLQDSKGRLAHIARLLSSVGVNIDYMYATIDHEGSDSKLVLHVSNIPLAKHLLNETSDAA